MTRGGTNPDLNARDQFAASRPIFPSSGHEYAGNEGHPVFWGGGGYGTLWNEAPFHNNQDLYVFKDDYSLVFGKHLLKVGGLFSTNKKNEDVGGYGLVRELGLLGVGRSARRGDRAPGTSWPTSC